MKVIFLFSFLTLTLEAKEPHCYVKIIEKNKTSFAEEVSPTEITILKTPGKYWKCSASKNVKSGDIYLRPIECENKDGAYVNIIASCSDTFPSDTQSMHLGKGNVVFGINLTCDCK